LFGCSLIYDLSPDQCGTNSDCSSFGSDFRCDEGMCVSNSAGGSGGSGGSSGAKGECESSADCLALDAAIPRACVGTGAERACVPLTTPSCPLILPSGGANDGDLWRDNLQARDSIVVGAFAQVPAANFSTFTRNYDLALTEFTRSYGGVPGPDATSRPLVVVVCDNDFTDSPAELGDSIHHLVDELQVPGIVAGLTAADLQFAFSETRASEVNPNVFFMSPLDSDPAIASLEDQHLVWNLLPSARAIATTYGPLLLRTIDYLHAQRGVPAGEPVKVALVTAPDLRLLGDLSDALRDFLQWNGKDFDANKDDGNLTQIEIVSSYENPTAPLTAEIQAIIDFAPHIVIEMGADELFTTIMPAVEGRWDSDVPDQPRPFYLISPYHQVPSVLASAVSRFRTPDPLHLRMAGVQYASTPDELRSILDDYNDRYDTMFPDAPGKIGWENWYDAPWWLIYAITAGARTQDRFDGLDLAAGMERLMGPGPEYSVGPDDIDEIVQSLSVATNTVTLNGALGRPDFDSTGARSSSGSVWCVNTSGALFIDVLRMSPDADPMAWSTDDLVGDGFMQCNPDF
jgi:hypothetical protein